ncbi:hypothetical protein ABZ023_33505 [Streptomyces sp. NPDC006367]|uniref:hypothetical protein n=1 Tax=unclassified Streptomyces TaxID=2593676 RepID=UPI00339E5D60
MNQAGDQNDPTEDVTRLLESAAGHAEGSQERPGGDVLVKRGTVGGTVAVASRKTVTLAGTSSRPRPPAG